MAPIKKNKRRSTVVIYFWFLNSFSFGLRFLIDRISMLPLMIRAGRSSFVVLLIFVVFIGFRKVSFKVLLGLLSFIGFLPFFTGFTGLVWISSVYLPFFTEFYWFFP